VTANLIRQWIGIDVSPTACRVKAKRMRDVCHLKEDEKLWKSGRGFVVRDLPWSIEKLRELPPFEFENWAVIALGGVPNVAKVGDKNNSKLKVQSSKLRSRCATVILADASTGSA